MFHVFSGGKKRVVSSREDDRHSIIKTGREKGGEGGEKKREREKVRGEKKRKHARTHAHTPKKKSEARKKQRATRANTA